MKILNSVLPSAIVAALLLSPVSLELSVSIAVLAGVSALMLGDYGRDHSAIALRA